MGGLFFFGIYICCLNIFFVILLHLKRETHGKNCSFFMAVNIALVNGKHSFYSVREKAWHLKGTVVDHYQSSGEVIMGSGLGFTVEKRKLFATDQTGSPSLNVSRSFATVRTDIDQVLGIVGEKFHVVQNIDAFRFFDDIVKGEGIKFETAGALGNGETIFISAKLPSYIKVGNEDISEKYLFLTNSHDGSKAVTIAFTPVRIVCNNTLNHALGNCSNKHKIMHTENAEAALKEAEHFMGITNSLSDMMEQAFNSFAKVRITDSELKKLIALAMKPTDLKVEDIIKGDYSKASTYFVNVVDNVLEYNAPAPSQQLDTTKGTVFGALNAVTGYYQNVRNYESKTKQRSAADAQLDSILFGNTALRTQKIFDLCNEAAKSTLFLN